MGCQRSFELFEAVARSPAFAFIDELDLIRPMTARDRSPVVMPSVFREVVSGGEGIPVKQHPFFYAVTGLGSFLHRPNYGRGRPSLIQSTGKLGSNSVPSMRMTLSNTGCCWRIWFQSAKVSCHFCPWRIFEA